MSGLERQEGAEVYWRSGRGVKTDRRRFPTQTLISITSLGEFTTELRVTEMYPYTQLHLGETRSVAIVGPYFLVLGSGYVIVCNF